MSERTNDHADDVLEIELEIELSEAEVEELSARLIRSLNSKADSDAPDPSTDGNNVMRRNS